MRFTIYLIFLCSLGLHADAFLCHYYMQKLPLYTVEADGFFVIQEYEKAKNKYVITADMALQTIEECSQIEEFDFNLFNGYYSYAQERLEDIKSYK